MRQHLPLTAFLQQSCFEIIQFLIANRSEYSVLVKLGKLLFLSTRLWTDLNTLFPRESIRHLLQFIPLIGVELESFLPLVYSRNCSFALVDGM